jgi:hypothetical protein
MTPSRQDSRFNILLIQPPIRDFYLTAKRTIPYGLASIAAGLIEAGFSVQILDALATPKSRVVDLPQEMSYLRPFYGRPDQSPFALFHNFKHFGYSFDTIGQRVKNAQPFLVGISSLFSARFWSVFPLFLAPMQMRPSKPQKSLKRIIRIAKLSSAAIMPLPCLSGLWNLRQWTLSYGAKGRSRWPCSQKDFATQRAMMKSPDWSTANRTAACISASLSACPIRMIFPFLLPTC